MKHLIMLITAALGLLCSSISTSCVKPGSTSGVVNQTQLDGINAIVEVGTTYATSTALKSNTEIRLALSLAADAIGLAVQAGEYDPTAVRNYINNALKDQSPYAQTLAGLGLTLALNKYAEFYDTNIAKFKDDHHVFASFLSAIGNGVRTAVAQSASGTVKSPPAGPNPLETLDHNALML